MIYTKLPGGKGRFSCLVFTADKAGFIIKEDAGQGLISLGEKLAGVDIFTTAKASL